MANAFASSTFVVMTALIAAVIMVSSTWAAAPMEAVDVQKQKVNQEEQREQQTTLLQRLAPFSSPAVTNNNINNNLMRSHLLGQSNGNNNNQLLGFQGGASCYDSRLTNIINYAVTYYAGNMGSATIYILDQIRAAGFSGYWLVHAQMLSGRTQGIDWQSLATGDIFKPKSRYGCYYNDGRTFVLVVSY